MGKRRNTFSIVREVNVDDAALKAIARSLGVPEAEHDRIESVSGEIVIRSAPTRPASTTTAQSGSSSDSSAEHPPPAGTGETGN
jgi:hypothetical protein